jgi:hypothetical protein
MGDRASILQSSNISITYSGNLIIHLTRKRHCDTSTQTQFSSPTSSTKGNYKDGNIEVSRHLLALHLGEYWFWISLYVYDHNRPLAPILKLDKDGAV